MVDRSLRPEQPSGFSLPDGFPSHMLLYDKFAGEPWHYHPRDVDRLTRDELFWLPVIRDAKAEAAETLAKIRGGSEE